MIDHRLLRTTLTLLDASRPQHRPSHTTDFRKKITTLEPSMDLISPVYPTYPVESGRFSNSLPDWRRTRWTTHRCFCQQGWEAKGRSPVLCVSTRTKDVARLYGKCSYNMDPIPSQNLQDPARAQGPDPFAESGMEPPTHFVTVGRSSGGSDGQTGIS
jgi:hypothetical protein